MENNRRNGKIARLPKDVRDMVSQMIEDGATYDTIIQKLAELGYPNINRVNLHKWKNGGYRDWQVHQLKALRRKNDRFIQEWEYADGAGLASMHLASHHFHKILTEFDPDALRRRLTQKPECYFELMLAYTRLVKNRISFENLIKQKAREKIWAEERARKRQEREKQEAEEAQKLEQENEPTKDENTQQNKNDVAAGHEH